MDGKFYFFYVFTQLKTIEPYEKGGTGVVLLYCASLEIIF